MITAKLLRLVLIVIGGWAISPTAWANSPEDSAEISFQAEQGTISVQNSKEQFPSSTVKDWMAQIEASLV